MTATPQRAIDLRNADGTRLTFRPYALLDVEGVRNLTGLDEDEINAQIEEGALLWAWNIGLDTERTQLRVWDRSVICYVNPKLTQPQSLDGVLETLLPPASLVTGTLDSKEMKRVFNTGHLHVARLCEAGLLMEHAKSAQRAASGPNGKRIITRASVARFFEKRRRP